MRRTTIAIEAKPPLGLAAACFHSIAAGFTLVPASAASSWTRSYFAFLRNFAWSRFSRIRTCTIFVISA